MCGVLTTDRDASGLGELGSKQDHLQNAKTGCGYVEIECPNGCYDACEEFGDDEESYKVKQVLRKDLKHHLQAECRWRRYQNLVRII